MKTLNKTRKDAQRFITEFEQHKNFTLFDIYQKPSYNKIRIFENYKNSLTKEGYRNISVISGGSSYFTIGCENDEHIKIITFANDYIIEK